MLNPDALDAIFVRFQKSWETASRKAKEKLLELMGRFGRIFIIYGIFTEHVVKIRFELLAMEFTI